MRRSFDFGDHGFQPVLEFPLHSGAGLEQPQVQRPDGDIPERLRHVSGHDAKSESLDHGCLAHAGLARQNRIVLPPTREDVDNLANLEVAADDRVDLPFAGPLGEVECKLIQRGGLRGSGRHAGLACGTLGRHLANFGFILDGAANQLANFFLQFLAGDLVQLGRRATNSLRQATLGKRRRQQVPGANPE